MNASKNPAADLENEDAQQDGESEDQQQVFAAAAAAMLHELWWIQIPNTLLPASAMRQ